MQILLTENLRSTNRTFHLRVTRTNSRYMALKYITIHLVHLDIIKIFKK